jgi:hypothetical protein
MRAQASVGGSGTGLGRGSAMPILECGRIAHRILAGSTVGSVCAVFRRSCYLEFVGGQVVCVGDRSLGRGPLNARVDRFQPPRLGEVLALRVDGAKLWQPTTRQATVERAALLALCAAARTRVPAEGFGGLLFGRSSPLIEHARVALAALERWLSGAVLDRDAETLLGLGPGLTPSGDDYLGGMMIALRTVGRGAEADTLWAWLAPRAPARTSKISMALLAAAAEGEAHESLHACLEALGAGVTAGWPERLDRLASLGHCSGWDGLAGVLAVAQRVAA